MKILKPLVLVQSRTSSKRLPFKALLKIRNLQSIILLLKRVENKKKFKTVVLTSSHISDDYLCNILKKNNYKFFRGNLKNVKSRFLEFTKNLKNEQIIIRLTADNLLIDKHLIMRCLDEFKKKNVNYQYIDNKKSNLPYGISLEIFYLSYLRKSKNNSIKDLEHVTFSFEKKNFFNIKNNLNLKSYRCSLDYFSDLNFVKKIFKREKIKAPWHRLIKKILTFKKEDTRLDKLKINTISTKKLSKKKLKNIFDLKDLFWRYGYKSQLIYFKKNYNSNDLHNFISIKNKIVGYYALRINKKFIIFDAFVIHPKFQKKGLSEFLILNSIIQLFKLKKPFYLYCIKDHINFYKKFGWSVNTINLFPRIKNKKLMILKPKNL